MPVIRVKTWRLEELTELKLRELEEALFRLKCELEVSGDYAQIEVNSDRPDMLIGEGIARAVNGLLGKRRGWRLPKTFRSSVSVSVNEVSSRPYIACAVVRNVNVDSEDFLEELIQFQEKLHDGLGRRRKKVAIGLHDLNKLPSKHIEYVLVDLKTKFRPLGSSEETTIGEVLNETEKGRAYGNIALHKGRHPALIAGDHVIAIPPVLNSDITKVEVGTKDLFIDVTGTDEKTVLTVLDILVSTLAERRGAQVEMVEVEFGEAKKVCPIFSSIRMSTTKDFFTKSIGIELSVDEIADHLERMLHNVSVYENFIEVSVAPFRIDVMKPIDLAEDLAISIGYEKISEGKRDVRIYTVGTLSEATKLAKKLRELAIGFGFVEVARLTLTSPHMVSALEVADEVIHVSNPVQLEYSVLRPTLAITLLEVFREEQHKEKPLKVFEIGPAISRSSGSVREDFRFALGILDYSVGYEDVQAVVYSLIRILGLNFYVEPSRLSFLIKGRQASIMCNGLELGWMGEVRPEVLETLGLEYPIALAELSLRSLLKALKREG
ncbi:MAG: phenylalanine--tRNA ligase subunit beta [Acidilobaceae archaeon]